MSSYFCKLIIIVIYKLVRLPYKRVVLSSFLVLHLVCGFEKDGLEGF